MKTPPDPPVRQQSFCKFATPDSDWGYYIGIMDKKTETTIVYGREWKLLEYIGILYRDNGKEIESKP